MILVHAQKIRTINEAYYYASKSLFAENVSRGKIVLEIFQIWLMERQREKSVKRYHTCHNTV